MQITAHKAVTRWKCKCECGTITIVYANTLQQGRVRSCGCIKKEIAHQRSSVTRPGMTYGFLTVIEKVASNKEFRAIWKCLCSCGSAVMVLGKHLRSGNTKSCGCLQGVTTSNLHRLQLEGKVFGRLTVIGFDKAQSQRCFWKCQCICGGTTVATSGALQSGNTKSCGCLHRQTVSNYMKLNLAGKTYGNLTGITEVGKSLLGLYLWEFKCACGTIKVIPGSHVASGYRVSCGCARGVLFRSPEIRERGRIASHRRRARIAVTGGTFTSKDVDDRFRWQRGRCAMPWCRKKLCRDEAVLDHIKPLSPRYREGMQLPNLNDRRNTQLTCDPCNSAKSDKDPITHAQANGWLL